MTVVLNVVLADLLPHLAGPLLKAEKAFASMLVQIDLMRSRRKAGPKLASESHSSGLRSNSF